MVASSEQGCRNSHSEANSPLKEQDVFPKNSFVAFVESHSPSFDNLSSLTRELRTEKRGWENSPSFEELPDDFCNFAYELRSSRDGFSSKEQRKIRNAIRGDLHNAIFGNVKEIETLRRQVDINLRRFRKATGNEKSARLDRFLDKVGEMSEDYHDAITPIVASLASVKRELLSEFKEYLESEYSCLFETADFLSNPNCKPQRETLRPFFASLLEDDIRTRKDRKEGILDIAKNMWIDRMKGCVPEEIIPRWIRNVLNSPKRENRNIAEWLKLIVKAASPVNQLTPEELEKEIVGAIRTLDQWPSDLWVSYASFATSEISSVVATIKKSLEQFRASESAPVLPPVTWREPKIKTRGEISPQPEDSANDEARPAEEKGMIYSIGEIKELLGGSSSAVRLWTEEEVDLYVAKRAGEIAKGDKRMLTDVGLIMESLREDPYGLGTKKLKARMITISQQAVPLRSFNPGRRGHLSFQHEQSQRLRAIYALCQQDETPLIIVLVDINTHEEYEKDLRVQKF